MSVWRWQAYDLCAGSPPEVLRARVALLLLLALALPETILAGTDPCPESFIDFLGSPSASTVATRDSTLYHCWPSGYNDCGPGGAFHSQRGAYDLVAGTILSISDSFAAFSGGTTSIGANDVYRIQGPSAGAMTFAAELHVQSIVRGFTPGGERFAMSWVRLRLLEGANSAECFLEGEAVPGGPSSYSLARDTTLTLSPTHGVGEPFALTFAAEAFAESNGYGEIRGQLRFIGLPDGYQVVSCQGFGGGPTPAVRRSWGRLKAQYR